MINTNARCRSRFNDNVWQTLRILREKNATKKIFSSRTTIEKQNTSEYEIGQRCRAMQRIDDIVIVFACLRCSIQRNAQFFERHQRTQSNNRLEYHVNYLIHFAYGIVWWTKSVAGLLFESHFRFYQTNYEISVSTPDVVSPSLSQSTSTSLSMYESYWCNLFQFNIWLLDWIIERNNCHHRMLLSTIYHHQYRITIMVCTFCRFPFRLYLNLNPKNSNLSTTTTIIEFKCKCSR